ncbi:MAG: hypothetical protein ACREQQ_04085 [Candidatus Binatia bacterium]
MGRVLLVVGLLASAVFGWHLYGAADARRHAEELRSKHSIGSADQPVTVNPVTNVVVVPISPMADDAKSDNPFEALGHALGSVIGGALVKAVEPSIERELNLRAREQYDVYAMILPYRVSVVIESGDTSREDS